MARFDPPAKFSFIADEWNDWIAEYRRYRRAVKLYADSGEDQRDQLLYAMGVKEAEKIFKTFKWEVVKRKKADGSEEDYQEVDTDFDCLMGKFTKHFIPMVNIRYERRKFNERIQGKDESVESFIRALYSLVATCKYPDEDDMILDRLIAGLQDTRVRTKLQMDPSIDLEKAIRVARNNELVHNQEGESAGNEAALQEVHRKVGNKSYSASPSVTKPPSGHKPHLDQASSSHVCSRCGENHGNERCPAIGKQCHYCKRGGHFISVCRKKKCTGIGKLPEKWRRLTNYFTLEL